MRHLTVLVPIALLLAACGAEREAAPAAAKTPAPAAEVTPPPPNLASVEISGGRVTVRADGVPRAVILQQLADQAGFLFEQTSVDWSPLELSLEGGSLEEALDRILEGLPYGVEYVLDPQGGGHALARVRVGTEGGQGPPAAAAPRASSSAGRAAAVAALQREKEPIDDELRDRLVSADPIARREALSEIDPEGEGLRILVEALESDPDPEVRAGAAEELGYAGTFEAVRVLLEALEDRDAQVVVQVLDALDAAGDETLVPRIQPLLEHRDPDVREAAREAIESLE